MNKKISTLAALFLIGAILLTPPILVVQAKNTISTDKGNYTEYIGTLGGANFALLKPKVWNGMLVVGCRFFIPQVFWDNYPNDPKHPMLAAFYNFGVWLTSQGYAFAYSTYGETGWCVQKGMIRTHQLTEYVIETFDVSGRVFLYGYSLGYIAVLLAEKYPELYDGVLDVVGTKDLKIRYNSWIGLPDPYGILPAIRAECGGTPEEKPKAYEGISPINNAALRVKVISLYGQLDNNVLPIHAELFADAVEAAGSSAYYRSYMYEGYGHGTFGQVPTVLRNHFNDLVDWVINDVEPPADPYPIPPPA